MPKGQKQCWRCVWQIVGVVVSSWLLPISPGFAAGADSPFSGVELLPVEGTFVVSQDNLNVRAQPRTGGERVTQLAKGDRVTVIGKAKGGEWYAVRKDGQDLGFAYAPVLLRQIDGRLEEDLKGTAKSNGVTCSYTIRFESQNEIEGEVMRVADYWTQMDCRRKGKKITFSILMFLTELPYLPNKQSTFQIGVEVADVGVDYDRALSSIVMYDFDEKTVTFDSISPKEFAKKAEFKSHVVNDVKEALTSAVEISLEAWNDEFWKVVWPE